MPEFKLIKRKYIVTVQTDEATAQNPARAIQFSDLDITFTVKKNLKPEPNTCELHIFNLNAAHRSALEQLKTSTVQIEAGYESGTSVIFLGNTRVADSGLRSGPDIITTLAAGDGEKAVRTARVAKTFTRETTTDAVLKHVAESLGVGEGNLKQAISTLKLGKLGNLFSEGTVLSGNSARELTNICRSLGLIWSVQNGKLQIIPLKQSLDGEAIKLSAATGMVGSPSVDSKGVLKVKMLLIPEVFPGRKLVLESTRLKGQYRIEAAQYQGDIRGGDWYIDIEGKRY